MTTTTAAYMVAITAWLVAGYFLPGSLTLVWLLAGLLLVALGPLVARQQQRADNGQKRLVALYHRCFQTYFQLYQTTLKELYARTIGTAGQRSASSGASPEATPALPPAQAGVCFNCGQAIPTGGPTSGTTGPTPTGTPPTPTNFGESKDGDPGNAGEGR